MKKILVLNGSPSGKKGNSAKFIRDVLKNSHVNKHAQFEVVHLNDSPYSKSLRKSMSAADAFVFVTGTYWDSWGSPLQKLLEDMTELEGDATFMGKPAAVCVLMHSVGGKGILSRLQGVLSTFGCLIPPMSGMVYSLVSDIALSSKKSTHSADFWQKEDADLILQNLLLATELNVKWAEWSFDKKNPKRLWI